jgi:hypothetical protein
MTAAVVEHERLAEIHETGYWRVIIRPTVFEERRIPKLSQCWRIVDESQVRLRGWYYPYIDRDERVLGGNWIQSGSKRANHVELWRFFQSGQFVHHRALPEDRDLSGGARNGQSFGVLPHEARIVSFLGLIYTMTEILVFARNLAFREALDPAADILIELHGVNGHSLWAPNGRFLGVRLMATADPICWHQTVPTATLLATADDLALDAIEHVLERFGWDDPPRRILAEEQQRLLERRL